MSLSAPSTNTVTVEYETLDGRATHSEGYEETSGRLTFIPGKTEQTQVGIVNDSETESSENFHLLLSDPVHSTLADDTRKVDRFKTLYAENPSTVETLAKVADSTNKH